MSPHAGASPMRLLLLALLALQSNPTTAQERRLEEVIVTAEKRESSLQDTPLAVSAFTQQELERNLLNNTMDIQFTVPNMLMSKDFFSSAQITIRGIGNLATGASADSGTGVHVNGVYLASSRIFETEYFDTARVEVLRGPQGTLYGRNTTAGVINVITEKPGEDAGGFIDASYGDYDYVRTRAAVNIPITDRVRQRFSLFYTQRDGYVDNVFDGDKIDGRDMYALRSSTLLQVSDRTDATLVINYFDEDSDRLRGAGNYCAKDPDGILGCLPNRGKPNGTTNIAGTVGGALSRTVGLVIGQPFPTDDFANALNPADERTVNLDFKPAYEADETIATLEINHDFGDLRLTSLTGYQESSYDARSDNDGSVASEPWPVTVAFPRGPDGPISVDRLYQNDRSRSEPEQWTQELRLLSNFDGPLNFLAGGFYLDYDGAERYTVYSSAIVLFGQTFGVPEDQIIFDNETREFNLESWAAFGEIYYDVRDDLRLTVGVRYTDEQKDSLQRTIYLNFLDDPTAANRGYQRFKDDWQETTGRFNLTWHATDTVMAYANIARSYKSGGFNAISPGSAALNPDLGGDPGLATFDPEYVNSMEVGARTRLLGNRLQANVTAFYYDYEDLQVSKIVALTALNENTDADVMGVEGEFVFAPDQHWTLSATLSWLDTELGDFETLDPADPNQMGTTEDLISIGNANLYLPCNCAGLEVDVQNNSLPNAPDFSAWLQARYSHYLANGMRLDLQGSYYYQDQFYTRVFNTRDDRIDAWDQWNASAVLHSAGEDWYLEAWGRNLTNEDNISGQYLQDASIGLYRTYQLLEPRTYGVTAGYRF